MDRCKSANNYCEADTVNANEDFYEGLHATQPFKKRGNGFRQGILPEYNSTL